MKKLIFVLPLCIFLANCTSSKKATQPAGPGISNVSISANGSAPTTVKTSATISPSDRDWAYTSKHDSTLNGNWALQGMLASNGTWTSAIQDTAASVAGTSTSDVQGTGSTGTIGAAGSMSTESSVNTTTDASATTSADNASNKGVKTKNKVKNNSKAIYDSAQVRLGYEVQSAPSVIDSSLLQPFKYWGRTPSLVINTSNRVFAGTTGCNSMSGNLNFSGSDVRFRAINTSKMNCNDYDEAGFISALKKVDGYAINGNQLDLKQGSTVLLTFAKK